MSKSYHQSVLLKESLESLEIVPHGAYADLTFGGGGHTKAILKQLTTGQLFAFDQDQDTTPIATQIQHPGFIFIRANFRSMRQILAAHSIEALDGILADLGVSSHQLDTGTRGFATRLPESTLDMRMDQTHLFTAQELLNTATVEELARILKQYGNVKHAQELAESTVMVRCKEPLRKAADLMAIVKPFAPKHRQHKYAAKVFQALRIHINDEYNALLDMLKQSIKLLKPGGRLVVIAYHDLEDGLVKRFMKSGNSEGHIHKDNYGNLLRPLKPLYNKPLRPSPADVTRNNRCRSARMRAAIRTSYSIC